MSIELSELKNFIEDGIRQLLQCDLRELKIIKEADIECCTYYHLRRFIGDDHRWKVLARKHSPTKRYTDLLIFFEKKPCIAIELKWDKKKMSKKDRRSLMAARRKLSVDKAYFIVCSKKIIRITNRITKNKRRDIIFAK